jgi:hypothetical protein
MLHRRFAVSLILVLGATILFAAGTVAGEKKITKKDLPIAVLAAFEKAYPRAVIRGLSKEEENGKTSYEIESIDGKTHRDLLYSPDGTTAEIEETLASNDLPDAVKATLAKEFPGGKILKAEKLTRASVTEYEVVISSGKVKRELVLDPAGALVNQKVKNEKEGEKD